MSQESYTEEELTDYEINRRTELVWNTWAVYDTVQEKEIVRGSLKQCNNHWWHTWKPDRYIVRKSIQQETRQYSILPIMEDIENPRTSLTSKLVGWYIECPDGSVFGRYPYKTYKEKAVLTRTNSRGWKIVYLGEITKVDLWLPRMIVRSLNFLLRELNEKTGDPRCKR